MYSTTPYYSSTFDEYKDRQLKQRTGQDFVNDMGGYSQPNRNIQGLQQPSQSTQQGRDISPLFGTVANGVGSALQAGAQPKQVTPYTAQLQKSQNIADSGIAAAASAVPILRGFMKLGQGIGAQTTDEYGIYKGNNAVTKTANSFIDNNLNPTTGLQNLSDFSKDITWGTALNQFTGGLLGKSASQKRAEKGKANAIAKFRAQQTAYNKNNASEIAQQNQLQEYNKRMNNYNRQNNLYTIPQSYQQMF